MADALPLLDDATLLIVGHGSARVAGSGHASRLHADTLRARGLFADVRAVFLKEEPFLDGILETIDSPRVFVVPNMASQGYLTESLIPQALGLTGRVTERLTPKGRQRVYLCDPVGVHLGLLDLAASAVSDILLSGGLSRVETAVLVAGHGNPNNPVNAEQTRQIANRIRNGGHAGAVRCAFLEEAPFLRDWRDDIPAKNIIVLPFLISGGVHGGGDIPQLMGIAPDDPAITALLDGAATAGPYAVEDRSIWYLRPIGAHPAVADIILDCVNDAL